ncbi:hypothetical protein NOF04DRAFT_6507 [Fusarium oxysporum II5]|nr:hypothetical protein NOF04DRAFT_6507 [Fusarium oxysporum II5]
MMETIAGAWPNIFVDEEWNVTCFVDLEWISALPVEMLAVPYWLTGYKIDEIKGDHIDEFNQVRQEFVRIFEEEEKIAPFFTPKRPSRVVRPTSKVRDTARQLEDTAKETRKTTRQTTRTMPAEEQINRPTKVQKSSSSGSSSSDRRAILQKALDLRGKSCRETKQLQEALKE